VNEFSLFPAFWLRGKFAAGIVFFPESGNVPRRSYNVVLLASLPSVPLCYAIPHDARDMPVHTCMYIGSHCFIQTLEMQSDYFFFAVTYAKVLCGDLLRVVSRPRPVCSTLCAWVHSCSSAIISFFFLLLKIWQSNETEPLTEVWCVFCVLTCTM